MRLSLILEGKKRKNAGCIVFNNNSILVIVTNRGYEMPKGGVDDGESKEEAAIRETKEETGVTCEIVGGPIKLKRKNHITFLYPAVYKNGDLKPQPEEGIRKVKFVKFKDLKKNLIDWQKPILNRITNA